MALNLTPEYFEADRKYRQAQNPADKLAALEEMLRAIPKHKASEKKQADLKRRISDLRQASQHVKKAAVVDPYHIPPQGAGQSLLFGLPNSGKSSILGKLSNAAVKITEFPFGTALPVPGMVYHEDVPIEMVDLPPVTPEHVPAGMLNAIRNTQALLMIVDLANPGVLEDIDTLLAILREREVIFDPPQSPGEDDDDADDQQLRVGPAGIIVCTKADLPGAADNWAVLQELRSGPPAMMKLSSVTGEGLDALLAWLFTTLEVVRVYSKLPGKPADKNKPFILPVGSTVGELARMIHKEMAEHLKYARVFGDHAFSGQQVHAQHVLADRDVVELHT